MTRNRRTNELEVNPTPDQVGGSELVLRHYVKPEKGGQPLVPRDYPIRLDRVKDGLGEACEECEELAAPDGRRLTQEVDDWRGELYFEVQDVCKRIIANGKTLLSELEAPQGDPKRWRTERNWALQVAGNLEQGFLPFESSAILPIRNGVMHPKWGFLPPVVERFAEDNQQHYKDIDRLGRPAMAWARLIALRARDLLEVTRLAQASRARARGSS